MAKNFKFIEIILRDGIKTKINICFIDDIIEINGKVHVLINGEYYQTEFSQLDEFI